MRNPEEETLVDQALDNAYESSFDTLSPSQREHWQKALQEGLARVALAQEILGEVPENYGGTE